MFRGAGERLGVGGGKDGCTKHGFSSMGGRGNPEREGSEYVRVSSDSLALCCDPSSTPQSGPRAKAGRGHLSGTSVLDQHSSLG